MGVFINSYMWGSEEAPGLPYAIMVSFAVMGWIVIIPYYYYVRSTQKKKKKGEQTDKSLAGNAFLGSGSYCGSSCSFACQRDKPNSIQEIPSCIIEAKSESMHPPVGQVRLFSSFGIPSNPCSGDIGFRSVDRKDSRTAIACIQALCLTLDIFREQKRRIDGRFFQVEVSEFPMLSKSGCKSTVNRRQFI